MLEKLRIRGIKFLVDLNERFIFERRLARFYKAEGSKLQTIVDVGANKGQSIDFFLKLNPECTIFSFEPNPKLFDGLTKKYLKNQNVKLFKYGVSDSIGEKMFYENVFDYTSSFETLNLASRYLKKKSKILGTQPHKIIKDQYPVKVTTLSAFINEHLDRPIDVLKIDTEGHEYACLLGLFDQALKVNIRYIQLENHKDDMYTNRPPFEKIKAMLKQNNFHLTATLPHGLGEFDEVIFVNAGANE